MLCLSICFLFGQHGTDSLFSYCTCSFAPEMCVCSITFAPGFYFCIFCFVTLWHYVKDIVNWLGMYFVVAIIYADVELIDCLRQLI